MDEYLSVIKLFACSYAPQEYRKCDGSLMNISENLPLFSLIGTKFGGDGINTFALPNLERASPHSELVYAICVQGLYPLRD